MKNSPAIKKQKPRAVKKKGLKLRRVPKKISEIVIDRDAGLVFPSEQALFSFFKPEIDQLDQEFLKIQSEFPEEGFGSTSVEAQLDLTLEDPAEIWHDSKTLKRFPVFHFIRAVEELNGFHIACCYVNSEDESSFVFLHFLTKQTQVVEKFRRGEIVFDRAYEEVEFGMVSGDALGEGDPLAMGLFISMLKVRDEKDIPRDKFKELGEELREDTIEGADEIWRSTDSHGNSIVTFIRAFPDHAIPGLQYVAVTQEDEKSQVHSLLFSFPTSDENLVDRYRFGQNLQAEEVSQESSH